jgi:hypothetical protein
VTGAKARVAPALFEEEFAGARARDDHLKAISNAACKPQARDNDMTVAAHFCALQRCALRRQRLVGLLL